MSGLPLRTQRLIALGLLLACLSALWSLVVAPIRSQFHDLDQQIETSQQTLLGYRRVAETGTQLRRRIDEFGSDDHGAGQVLTASSAGLAAADLQRQVIGIIEELGGAVQSAEILPSEPAEFFQKVAVRIALTADTVTLQAAIHALETATPLLFVDNLDIRLGTSGGQRTPRRGKEDLQLRLDVYGFLEARAP